MHCSRGLSLQNLNRYDEALASLGEALRLEPGLAVARNARDGLLGFLRRYR